MSAIPQAPATEAPSPIQFYRSPVPGTAAAAPAAPKVIKAAPRNAMDTPDRYYADPDLEAAVNTALLLGMPLLLTGRPGCGKTQLGRAVAHALGYRPFKFETKSTSQARDLFYLFDVVGRFQARQTDADDSATDPRYFIRYQALGLAILLSQTRPPLQHLLPLFRTAADKDDENALLAADWGGGQRSVVVVDEVDKAPRDFPNDILNEIERLSFTIPEIGGQRVPPPPDEFRPFVVFTSNSEKQLPDAFLRRCLYYHIEEPTRERLLDIVEARLRSAADPRFDLGRGDALVGSAATLFTQLRDGAEVALKKPPGIAEFLNWLQALGGMGADHGTRLGDQPNEIVERSMTVLLKFKDDRDAVLPMLRGLLEKA